MVTEAVASLSAKQPGITPDYFKDVVDLLLLEQCVQTQDMFNPQKLILIQNPHFLTKALSDKDLDRFKSIIQFAATSPHTVVIYMLEKSVDGRKKAVSFLKKNAQSQEFKAFKDWEQDKVFGWIKQAVQKLGKTISPQALPALEQNVGLNLRELNSTLQIIATYIGDTQEITVADVETMCSRGTSSAFKLTDAMQKNNSQATLKSISALIEAGEDPIRLLGLVIANTRLFTQLLLGLKDGQRADQMAKSLGKNPYYLKKLIPTVQKNHTLAQCLDRYQTLSQTDLSIKTGQLKPKLALVLWV